MSSNIVHQYFKKEEAELKILLKVNPIYYTVTELAISKGGAPEVTEIEMDANVFNTLSAEGYEACSPLEFNLYINGLASE